MTAVGIHSNHVEHEVAENVETFESCFATSLIKYLYNGMKKHSLQVNLSTYVDEFQSEIVQFWLKQIQMNRDIMRSVSFLARCMFGVG